jgi:hypothetical protein
MEVVFDIFFNPTFPLEEIEKELFEGDTIITGK